MTDEQTHDHDEDLEPTEQESEDVNGGRMMAKKSRNGEYLKPEHDAVEDTKMKGTGTF